MFNLYSRIICVALYLVISAAIAQAELPQISSGLNYLTLSQNVDGTWHTDTSEVETTAATVTVLDSLKTLNQTAGTPYASGSIWLQAQTPQSVDYIAQRIRALRLTDAAQLVPVRDTLSGAWGGDAGYETDILDTALSLQAVKSANYTDATIINPALAYLTTTQNTDGGWGFYKGDDSNVYMTAVVSATLQQFPQMTTIATAVSRGTSFLLAHQNTDGGFGFSPSTVYETALAYTALAAVSTNAAVLGGAVNYLTTTQSANGSWNDDPYSTALALKALYFSENRPAPPPAPPAGGTITGAVVDAATNLRVPGVSVILGSNDLIRTTSDSLGSFTLNDVPPGSQSINFTLSGYASKTASAIVSENATFNLGNVPMVSAYSTGTIAGTVTDPAGQPLAGVAITVTGSWSGTATTGADGAFSFTYVTPGSVTISAAKSGYQTVTGTGIVYTRTTLTLSPRMSTTPSQLTTGTIVGRVVEDSLGRPIGHLPEEEGVTVKVTGRAAVEPDDRGYFTIEGLAPGTYHVTIGMNGFARKTFSVVITAGTVTDLGTIRLKWAFLMTLSGKVTDASTGQPIVGAEVTMGPELTSFTDFAGDYVIVDVPYPGGYTLKASAEDYIGKSYTIQSALWSQTANIALSPRINKGSFTGTIVDASTNLPLNNTTLTVTSNPAITVTTDDAGLFTLAAVPKGPQQITVEHEGYSSRTITAVIVAGTVNNGGVIPLSVTPLPAGIRGTVWDAVANGPFAGVAVKTGALESVTAADGTYAFDGVDPGTITVATAAIPKPGYFGARTSAVLQPGGLLIFNPSLSAIASGIVNVSVKTDKTIYRIGESVGISVGLRNNEAVANGATVHVEVTDPSGATVHAADLPVELLAEGSADQAVAFIVPESSPRGGYTVVADVYDVQGTLVNRAATKFAVAVSDISISPVLPAVFKSGSNAVSLNLMNTGPLAVATGVLEMTLKDPDGQVISSSSQGFSLDLGQSLSLSLAISVPDLKFGTYTLSYVQRDETKAERAASISLANAVTITPYYDKTSYRVREIATLTVKVINSGRFELNSGSSPLTVTAAVADAGYAATHTLTSVPLPGDSSGITKLFDISVPDTVTPGEHLTIITATLAGGSKQSKGLQLSVPESSLSSAPITGSYAAGGTIHPEFRNSGGVDTQVQYKLSLLDAKSSLLAETADTAAITAGGAVSANIVIPSGAVDGSYSLIVTYKDLKTGKDGIQSNPITVSGVKGSLSVRTDKDAYLVTENITGLGAITNTGTALSGGNVHLQVTTGPGSLRQKTWTTQADFQTGVRNGVDTYGVNDWIIPDDDFEGGTIDTNKWTFSSNVSLQNGKVYLNGLQSDAVLSSTSQLEGDFDIQTDFEQNNSVYDQGAALAVSCGPSITLHVHNDAASGYNSDIYIDGQQYWTPKGGYASSGRMRIVRTGVTFITYYWSGSIWTEVGRASASSAPPCTPWHFVWRRPNYYQGATAVFDNFKVNLGRIKTVNQTVDSVRLLPLNDNFDDGMLNLDRWKPYGNNPMENPGFLHIYNPPNPNYHTSGVSLRYFLPNDFQAYARFVNYSTIGDTTTGGQDLAENIVLSATLVGTKAGFGVGRCSSDPYYASGEFIIGWRYTDYDLAHTYYNPRTPYPLSFGELRVRRSGPSVASDFTNGSGWTNAVTYNGMQLVPVSLRVGAETSANLKMPAVQADMQHFYVTGSIYAQIGTLSQRFDAGKGSTKWGSLVYSATQPAGTAIKFRTRTADTEAGLATAIWSDYITASGAPITNPAARWIEVEATLATTDTNGTPLLHDITITYEVEPGQILWQADVPVDLAQGALSELSKTIGNLGVTGKLYLQGALTSSTGQPVASAEYPFYVEQGDFLLHLAPDRNIYRPGETVTISGQVINRSTVVAAGLTLAVTNQAAGGGTLYTETYDLAANSSRSFSFTTVAGAEGTYGLDGVVTQNTKTLAATKALYETANPVVTAALNAPDTAGIDPFTITLSLGNTGKVGGTLDLHVVTDGGEVVCSQQVSIPAGETRMLQYSRQIIGTTTYTAVMTGDLNQTLTKTVAYTALPTDGTVSGKVVTDKASYDPNDRVVLTTTFSSGSIRENLSSLVTVTNGAGQVVYSSTAAIPVVMPNQTVTSNWYWNTGSNAPGTYLVTLVITDSAGTVLRRSTCNLVVGNTTRPSALLKGQISLDTQHILTGEPVAATYTVTNAGNVDLAAVALSIQTVHVVEQTVYDTMPDSATLPLGASHTGNHRIETQGYSAKDYLVLLRASIDGVEETLAGTYFRVEGAPSAPALMGPANGTDVETFTPILSVSNAADPNDDKLSYTFEVYGDSGMTSLVSSATVPETTGSTFWMIPSALAENMTYFWRARAYDGRLYGPWMSSASFRVNTVNDPPSAPTLASPADGTTVAVLAPTLTATNASDPDSSSLTYNFEVAGDPMFSQAVASVTGVTSGQGNTSWTLPLDLQENGWYYWRAQADDWFIQGPWSAHGRFQVNLANDPPSVPVITAPANGSTVAALATDVVVTNGTDPDSPSIFYNFEADTVPTFDSAGIIRSGGIIEGQGTTLWSLTGLRDNTHYFLRARASDGAADSPWSAVTTFFANTANDPPTVPVLANPSNGTGVNVFTPTLSIYNASDLDEDLLTYEFEVYSDSAMTSLVARADLITETARVTEWTVPVLLSENETYYWRARAHDGLIPGGWMAAASFTVNTANDAPGVPGISSPVPGVSAPTLTPALSVVNAVDPDSDTLAYDFEVYSGNTLVVSATGVPEGISGITTWTPGTPLADNSAYQWRARAYDGDRYGPWTDMASFTVHVPVTSINATVNFDPDTLNASSNGTWVTVYIELPDPHKPADIDIASIRLEGIAPAEIRPYAIGDSDRDGIPDLMVKFRRNGVIGILPRGEKVPVHVSGKVGDVRFDGIDLIRVIDR